MFLDRILTRFAPHECLGCQAEGQLLCAICQSRLTAVPERCYRCRRITTEGKTCQTCRAHSNLYSVRPRAIYEGLAKDLVWRLKFNGAQAAATEMAKLMKPLLPADQPLVLVHIPTATSRVRKRGYDQAQLLAKALARETGLPYVAALRRIGQHHQVGASRAQRVTQLKQAYRCVRPDLVQNAHIILIDDVLTTGATLEAATTVIKANGATRVSGLVFAQA